MLRVRHSGLSALTGLVAAVLVAVALTGCAAPRYTFVANTSQHAYFKVPSGWTKISSSALSAAVDAEGSQSGTWTVGFDASQAPSAEHVLAAVPAQPFVYATVGKVSPTVISELSYNTLRDFFLPVTAAARQTAAKAGFPLTSFQLLSSSMDTPGQGIHGVSEIYDYTYPGGLVVTFDQTALTNADNTEVYLLLVHCLSACYSQNQQAIKTVMKSFTVRSP
jgi:hypothetical protein